MLIEAKSGERLEHDRIELARRSKPMEASKSNRREKCGSPEVQQAN